jgi:hypothetical protein
LRPLTYLWTNRDAQGARPASYAVDSDDDDDDDGDDDVPRRKPAKKKLKR